MSVFHLLHSLLPLATGAELVHLPALKTLFLSTQPTPDANEATVVKAGLSANAFAAQAKAWIGQHNTGLLGTLPLVAGSLFLLRRLLDLPQRLPGWNRALRFVGVPAVLGFVVTAQFHYLNPLLDDWYVLFVYGVVAALLLRLRHYRPARIMLWAIALPIAWRFIQLGLAVQHRQFVETYRLYFTRWGKLNTIWLWVLLFVAFYQKRALAKEQVQREAEEKVRQQVAAQNVELERLVAQRTTTLTQQATELQAALTELRATQAQLIQSEKMASLGELTAGIAHEIQNPLNFVNNFADVSAELVTELEDEQTRPTPDTGLEDELLRDLKHNLLKINQHGQRASSIVRGMLAHSRTSTGERAPTDVNGLCDEYLRLAYHGLRAKDKNFNATLDTDFAPGLPLVEAVAGDLGRVLLNLFTNAFYAVQKRQQAGEPGYAPTLRVQTRAVGDELEIRVRDNGTGMPAEVQAKIFQPFFTTKPTGEGTGLGLSLAHDIVVKGHGGDLTVASEPGLGTEFTIRIQVAS
ncbi:MAG: sensor histidine kinase [Janthinobacterium lividum]